MCYTPLDRLIQADQKPRLGHRREICYETDVPFPCACRRMYVPETADHAVTLLLEELAHRRIVQSFLLIHYRWQTRFLSCQTIIARSTACHRPRRSDTGSSASPILPVARATPGRIQQARGAAARNKAL
jgi:hypothetical protein